MHLGKIMPRRSGRTARHPTATETETNCVAHRQLVLSTVPLDAYGKVVRDRSYRHCSMRGFPTRVDVTLPGAVSMD